MANETELAVATFGAGNGGDGGGVGSGAGRANDAWLVVMATPTGKQIGGRYPLPPTGIVLGSSDSGFPIQPERGAVAELESPLLSGLARWRLRPLEGEVVARGELLSEPIELPGGASFELAGYHYTLNCGKDAEGEYHELIYRLTIADVPTGLHNKRYLLEALERELVRASKHKRPFHAGWLTAVTAGAQAQRAALRVLGQVVRDGVRRDWTSARVEKAGVVVLAPEASMGQVEHKLEAMTRELAAALPPGSSVRSGAMEWTPGTPGIVFFGALKEAMGK